MRKFTTKALLAAAMGLAGMGSVQAAEILVSSDITTSTTWTANNTYNLTQQVYVTNGATLTIEAGTIVASTPSANGSGSLAVTRGSKIFVQGTKASPVIMTSTNDVATWTGGNPKTGTWREAANEWGNLTICGRGYISENAVVANTATPNANNIATMEGLTEGFPGDTRVLYGGGNDNDDSGSINYLSIRYGGRVIGLNNELNGLSLGGIGRETDIQYVEIMNNVDDGIEIWGGTVNLKNVAIWNIGDDSFDIDQGWRGKAQFVLIVQGHSLDAAQGSGLGDNCVEIDGAEQSDYQPVTTATIYNLTAIGQPVNGAGDHGVAYRDGARLQLRNAVFMDLGERLVQNDNVDGDGGAGYGNNGTLSFANTWTTGYTQTSTVNAPANPSDFYKAQSAGNAVIGQGFLNEITDSVFFRNLFASNAYGTSDTVGVTSAGGSNAAKGNVVAAYDAGNPNANMPIVSITRGPAVTKGSRTVVPVIGLDPRAANAAVTSISSAPADGFFTPAQFRGAFSKDVNWLLGWTASDAFGYHAGQTNPAGPATTLALIVANSVVSFSTVNGVNYVVESSVDAGKTWVFVGAVVGDGNTKQVSEVVSVETGKLYRVSNL